MTNYDTYSTVGAAAGGFVGAILVFCIVIIIICLIVAVFQVIGTWKVLTKANKPGWGALIPFYNQYLLCQITGVNPWWILIVALSPILTVVPVIGSIASVAASIYFTILLNVSLARSFGKEDGFAVGLILLAPIFYFILGIKNDTYIGPKPMKDIIFKNYSQSQETQTNNNVNANINSNPQSEVSGETSNIKYCTSCGSQMDVNATFCSYCGKQS